MKTNSKQVDLSRLIKPKHQQKWVALSRNQDRVIAFAQDVKSVLEKAKQVGETQPVLTFAVTNYRGLVS